MVAGLARVRFLVETLKSGDSSYQKSNLDKALDILPLQPFRATESCVPGIPRAALRFALGCDVDAPFGALNPQ
jgi:hypothetical protein